MHHAQAASIYIATTETGHKKAGDLFRSTGFLWGIACTQAGQPALRGKLAYTDAMAALKVALGRITASSLATSGM